MAKILVTGLSGFTGQFLKQRLEQDGHQVVGLSSDGSRADLNDRSKLQQIVDEMQPDKVVHLAAISFVAHGNPDEIYCTNLLGTRNLLSVFSQMPKKPSHILIASSANIYGNSDVGVIDEKVIPAPANDYAVSKLAMEYMAKTWIEKLPITIVRPFNYTGVGQDEKFLLPKIVNHFKEKAPTIELGNLDVIRDFSDVRDVVNCYAKLLETTATGEIYNVCSGNGVSLLDVIEMMKTISNHDIKVKVNPAFVRANEVKKLIGSNKKLESRIGISSRYSLLDTLTWMYDVNI